MDQNLPRLVSELRKETCPQRVIDEVGRRIAPQTTSADPFRHAIPLAAACLVLLSGLAVWEWAGTGNSERRVKAPKKGAIDSAQIAQQAEGALGIIGTVFLDATAHSEKVIFNRAVPPLRNGLETAKKKIINRIEL